MRIINLNERQYAFRFRACAVSISLLLLTCLLNPAVVSAQTQGPVLTDQRGRESKFTKPVERIIAIPVPMASVIMALDGASRRVVGMHPVARQSIEQGFLKRVYPEALAIASDITRGGMFTPNMETVLSLKPDAVVTWSEPTDAVQTLERAGLPVVALTNDPPNLAVHESNLAILARLLGREDRLSRIRTDMERARAIVEKSLAGVTQKPRVIYMRQTKGAFQASGRNTFQDFWINVAGGRNVAGELNGHQPHTTIEQLIAWDPEVILLGTFDNATPAEIYANPALANVTAVRSRRVLKLPHGGYRWDPGSHESALQMLWAASVLHPDRFKPELRREMRAAYTFLYNHALTEGEIDDILQYRANAATAGYAAQFAK